MAQWQWVDSTGRKVFSDTPPPAGTPEKNIIKAPGSRVAPAPRAAVADTTHSQATNTAAASPKPSGRDEQLEAKKKQAEEAEQAKRKAEADKVAKARAENCERAKRAKATLDTGIRIATTNAKGEREIMDDKSRAEEAKRMDATIRSDCGPAPQAAQ
jgi:L-fucose mutarotase/ribose pyranase (RbsD/FucU family)